MPQKRIHRLLQLLSLLQGGEPRPLETVISHLQVSRRTVFRDLKTLQDAGIPCRCVPGLGYHIAGSAKLPSVHLTVLETLGLLLMGKAAATKRHRPLMGPALSAIHKLGGTVPQPMREACLDLMERVSISSTPDDEGGNEATHYTTLQRCIDEGRICQMSYQPAGDREPQLHCRIEPLALHYAVRAWYLMARTDAHDDIRTFKLARILTLATTRDRFERSARFRVADRLGSAWQLIPEGRLYDIELLFTPRVAMNVAEVRWHHSQQTTIEPDGACRARFRVDGLDEIAWWICGYADQVRVVEPPLLRDRVAAMLRRAAEQY